MKKRSLLKRLVFIFVLFSLLIFMIYPRHYLSSEITGMTTFTNEKEVFVFVTKSEFGEIASRFRILFLSVAGIPSPVQTLRKDTIILHYKEGQQPEKILSKDFFIGLGIIGFEGCPYKGGRLDSGILWRWTGKTFDKLPETEAIEIRKRMRNTYNSEDEQNESEGWQKNEYADLFAGNENTYQFNISENRLDVRIEKNGVGVGNTTVVSYQFNESNKIEIANINSSWRNVSKDEYFAEVGENTQINR